MSFFPLFEEYFYSLDMNVLVNLQSACSPIVIHHQGGGYVQKRDNCIVLVPEYAVHGIFLSLFTLRNTCLVHRRSDNEATLCNCYVPSRNITLLCTSEGHVKRLLPQHCNYMNVHRAHRACSSDKIERPLTTPPNDNPWKSQWCL